MVMERTASTLNAKEQAAPASAAIAEIGPVSIRERSADYSRSQSQLSQKISPDLSPRTKVLKQQKKNILEVEEVHHLFQSGADRQRLSTISESSIPQIPTQRDIPDLVAQYMKWEKKEEEKGWILYAARLSCQDAAKEFVASSS